MTPSVPEQNGRRFLKTVERLLDRFCPLCREAFRCELVPPYQAPDPLCNCLARCRDWREHVRCQACRVPTERLKGLLGWAKKILTTSILRDREVDDFLREAGAALKMK